MRILDKRNSRNKHLLSFGVASLWFIFRTGTKPSSVRGLFLPKEIGFSDEQKILANHFGVGLIEARLDESGKEVRTFTEVLASNYFSPPIQHKMDKILSHLGARHCC